MEWKVVLILIGVNIVYLLIGGLFFHLLETDNENDQKVEIVKFKDEFLKNFTCISEADFLRMTKVIVSAYNAGYLPADNSSANNWDYANSVFFASTVITTIGYGHIAPETDGGKVFCIFYAILGIPLCLVMLAALGIRLSTFASRLDSRLNMGFHKEAGKIGRAILLFCFGFSFFILIPAAIVMAVEDWGYGDAVYYAIISLTTVGFGDLVPTQNPENTYHWWYAILITIWLMLGLAWGATVISNAQELYEDVMHPKPKDDDQEDLNGNDKADIEDPSAGFNTKNNNDKEGTDCCTPDNPNDKKEGTSCENITASESGDSNSGPSKTSDGSSQSDSADAERDAVVLLRPLEKELKSGTSDDRLSWRDPTPSTLV